MSLYRSQKFVYTGVFMLVFSVLLQFIIVPPAMKYQIKKKVALKKGWPMRDIWSKLPFVIENHMYVFNVTNPTEIGNGAKPIVQEIGPFVYDIYQEKVDQVDHEEDDSVSYVLKNVYRYNLNKSNGLSDELEMYFPHTYIMTATNGIVKVNPTLASFVSKSVDSILNKPTSLFYKVKVRTALFDGFVIPCTGMNEYFGKLICNLLNERWYDFTVRRNGDNYYTSMFSFINGTYDKEKRVRINRGIKNLKNVGKIVGLDNKSSIATWNNHKCDSLKGTDGTIFAPLMNEKKREISIIHPALCRKINFTYESEVKFSGLKLFRYIGDLGTDGNHVPEDKCYCITPETCLKKGMFDTFKCTNVPIIMSNPHFHLADPYYLTRVDTLKPDKEKHGLYVDFDPITGIPVRAHIRVQFNMELLAIEQFKFTRNFSYAMLPMVWTDEITILPDFLLDEIKFGHKNVKLVKMVEYTMMIGGFIICALAGYQNYKSRKVTEIDLKPSTPSENVVENSSEIGSKPVKTIAGNIRPAAMSANFD